MARQRCQCNGPLWHGGWWCDEWPCDMFFCTFRYTGLADGDEVAFASNIALQAYFEGRKITRLDMDKCLAYWREHISEYHNPVDRKRPVMCEPFYIPCIPSSCVYRSLCQCRRQLPNRYTNATDTQQIQEVYDQYEQHRQRQIQRWVQFKHPARHSTICQILACQRLFGRKGLLFCTEGCCDSPPIGCCYRQLGRKPGDPFPPSPNSDWDEEHNAARVLQAVLGNPPRNVVYEEWQWDSVSGKYSVVQLPNRGKVSTRSQDEQTTQSLDVTNHLQETKPKLENCSPPAVEMIDIESPLPDHGNSVIFSPGSIFKGSY